MSAKDPARLKPIPPPPIDGYRMIEMLGSGGFGEVWKAEAPGGILKAIKIVHGRLKESPDDEEDKAKRELKGLSRIREIRHPFILSMDRFEVVDRRLIIVMELADRDMAHRMQECRQAKLTGIPREELLGYMEEAAEALDVLNIDYEILHLDIKPSNLFLVHQHVKVADFGLAKAIEGTAAQITGGMTPMYAAPEAFNSQVTRQSDQYSLAIVYQHMLTGKLPFPGPSPQQFMLQHLAKEPDLAPLPPGDREVLARAYAKDPAKRFPSCREMVKALRAAVNAKSEAKPIVIVDAPPPKRIIGIDLGTSNTVVANSDGDAPEVIADQEGNRLTPSVVAWTSAGEMLVGAPARRQAVTNPAGTLQGVKRLIGRTREELTDFQRGLPWLEPGDPKDAVRIKVRDMSLTPQQVSANVLRKVRESAEENLGEPVTHAVVTVPAYFNDSQRQATRDAGTIAGLEIVRIINEPTAAALAFGLDRAIDNRVAVFDLGGGTFDITVLRIRDGVFDVLSTAGDTMLGGDDFDETLVTHALEKFQADTGVDLRGDPGAIQRIREAAERAKIELSTQIRTEINLPFIHVDESGPKHLVLPLTRQRFDQLTADLVDRCREPTMKALTDAGLSPGEIDEVLLVGGSTRIPKVREKVREWFGREPSKSVNPDEAVALGAAIQGAALCGRKDDLLLLDVTPLSLGLEVRGGMMERLIERNTTIPTIRKEIFTTAHDQQREVGIHILQGEREFAKDNRSLGTFWLENIPPAPAGQAKIEVAFEIDASGILKVSAIDTATGIEQSLTVRSNSGIGQEDVDRMRIEAEQQAEGDARRRELARVVADAEQRIEEAEQLIRSLPTSAAREAASVRREIDKLKDLISAGDPLQVGTGMWILSRVCNAIKEGFAPVPDRHGAKPKPAGAPVKA